ncbi:hypothetical protein V8E36_005412 [Tilletia maclaganii]
MTDSGRLDFYQTATHVHVSVYAKAVRADSVHFVPELNAFSLSAHADYNNPPSSSPSPPVTNGVPADDSNLFIVRRKLFGQLDPARCSYTVRPSKVELHLAKAQPGQHWPRLQDSTEHDDDGAQKSVPSGSGTNIPTPAPMSTASIIPADAPVRKKNKWENFKLEDEDEEGAGVAAGGAGSGIGAGGDVNDFFKQLYAGASDDARKAMVKSFQESNGTTLSMNWDEVKKGKVETRPPDSMIARKYE